MTELFSRQDEQRQYELELEADRLLIEHGANKDKNAPCRTSSAYALRDRTRKTDDVGQIVYHLPASVPLDYLEELVKKALKCKASKIEAEIHALYECGYTNQKISYLLKLHRHTVAKHLRAAQNKIQTHITNDESWYRVYLSEVSRHHSSGISSYEIVSAEIREAREIIEEAGGIETFIVQEELVEGQLHIRLNYPDGSKYRLTQTQLLKLVFTGSVKLSTNQGKGTLDYFGHMGGK